MIKLTDIIERGELMKLVKDIQISGRIKSLDTNSKGNYW